MVLKHRATGATAQPVLLVPIHAVQADAAGEAAINASGGCLLKCGGQALRGFSTMHPTL